MSAIRKQLRWDDTIDIWPITDTSAIHYEYNPSDSSKILSPVQGTSYGLDHFLNGLVNRMLTTDDIVAAAINVNKGKGILYNTGSSITDVALPGPGTSNAFVRCTYTAAGVLSLAFTTTNYAGSSSGDGGAANSANTVNGGGAGQIVYQSGTNVTAFLLPGTDGQALTYDATNNKPKWTSITSNISTALFVGASNGTTTTAQSTNGNVHLILQEGSTYTRYCIEGAGRIAVTSNNVGKISITSTDPPNFGVATAETAGTAGLVPAPEANQLGSLGYYLRADGTWVIPPNNNVTQTATTTSASYELLFSGTADNTTREEGARKTSTLTYNPSTKALSTGGTVNGLTLSPQTTGFKISGGTTSKTLTVGADYTLANACTKSYTDSSSASAIGTGTSLPTERDIYYGLPTINGVHNYTSSTTLFAPTAVGTSGQILQSNGSGAPSWVSTENYTTVTLSTSETYNLSSSSWSAVSTSLSTTSGTYALYIDDSTNGSYSGVFSIEGGASEKLEEIPLHWATATTTTADSTRIYAAIKEGKLQLASNTSSVTSYTLTIKYKRII